MSYDRKTNQMTLADMLDRVPPNDQDAEKAIIASLIIDPTLVDDIAASVRETDYYDHRTKTIFRHVLKLNAENRGIDEVSLVTALRDAGELDRIGGADFLAEVLHSEATPAHWKSHSETIREKSERRRFLQACMNGITSAYDLQIPINDARSKLDAILTQTDDRSGIIGNDDSLVETMVEIERRRTEPSGVMTGFDSLDRMTGGFRPWQLAILGARPSIGKSAIALQMAEHVARFGQVLFVSCEMRHVEIQERRLARESVVSARRIQSGDLNEYEEQQIAEASGRLSGAGLVFLDRSDISVNEILREARRLKRSGDLRLIVIDYLQLLRADDTKLNRERQVAEMARALKVGAASLGAPVLLLSQLNRESDKSGSKPRLSHLRESGAIEQDADVALLLHRSTDDQGNTDAGLIVAKNRGGEVGEIPLEWDGPTMCYTESESTYREPSTNYTAAPPAWAEFATSFDT